MTKSKEKRVKSPIRQKRVHAPRQSGPGRPKSVDGDVTLHMRTTEDERAVWEAAAADVKMKLTTWIKMVVNTHLRDAKAKAAAAAKAS